MSAMRLNFTPAITCDHTILVIVLRYVRLNVKTKILLFHVTLPFLSVKLHQLAHKSTDIHEQDIHPKSTFHIDSVSAKGGKTHFPIRFSYRLPPLIRNNQLLANYFAAIFHDAAYKAFHYSLIFIQTISIVHLQVQYYSEALPTHHGYCVGVSRRNATGNCE